MFEAVAEAEAKAKASIRFFEAEAEAKFWPRSHFGLEDLTSLFS